MGGHKKNRGENRKERRRTGWSDLLNSMATFREALLQEKKKSVYCRSNSYQLCLIFLHVRSRLFWLCRLKEKKTSASKDSVKDCFPARCHSATAAVGGAVREGALESQRRLVAVSVQYEIPWCCRLFIVPHTNPQFLVRSLFHPYGNFSTSPTFLQQYKIFTNFQSLG